MPVKLPEQTLSHLKATMHKKSHRTLDCIYDVCTEHFEQGKTDFSYATIARVGEKRGVPKAQSIHNKTGEPYRILIDVFRESLPQISQSKPAAPSNWIESIDDPKIKLLVKIQEAELRQAQRMLKEIKPVPLTITVNDHDDSISSQATKLTNREREGLEYLLSGDFLEANEGIERGSRGDLYYEGHMIFQPGTFDGIEKALKYLS